MPSKNSNLQLYHSMVYTKYIAMFSKYVNTYLRLTVRKVGYKIVTQCNSLIT